MRYEDASQSGSFQDVGPVARDDADQLAAGDRGPATGNLITGAGTETGAAGADSGSGARISSISGAGGQDTTFASGQLRVDGEHGSLSVTARGDYVYRPGPSVPENSRDVFNYTLSDASGQSSQARLVIEIGKTQAVVAANAQRIVPGPDGVVVLPAGVELSDVRIVGRDLLIMLPDGSQLLIVDGAVFVPRLVIDDIEVPSTNLAALLIEQEPRPASGVPQSSGGNFANPVGPLDPGTPLGNLLPPTVLDYTPPVFQQVSLDEDRRPEVGANAAIQMDDDVRTGGNAGGVGDDPDAVNTSGTLSGSGGDGQLTFALSTAGAPAGFTYVAGPNGSVLVQQNGTTVLTVTLNAQTGAYSVTQNAAIQHAAGANENNVVFTFGYTVTDRDGDSATGSFQVNVDDDTPLMDVTAGADAGVTLTTDDADTRGELSDAVSSSANFGGVFGVAQSAGADGLGSASLTYALSTAGGASGLTQAGAAINLFQIGGKVVGSTATSAGAVTASNTVFDVSVSGTGVVTLTQYSQIDHAAEAATTSPFNDQLVSLADNLVTLTVSGAISDRDGDNSSDSVAVQIGANLRFSDDGPSIGSISAGAGVMLDETAAVTPAGFPISANSASAVITAAGLSFGADGEATNGAMVYSISVVGGGTTPLRTAEGNLPITLVQTSASVITGTFVEGGVTKTAFTITINTDGTLSVRQSVPLEHNVDGSTSAAFDDALDLAGLINATIRLTDRDGDTASATTGIGNLVTFRDDGPDSSLAFEAALDTLVLDESRPVGSDTDGGQNPAGIASVTANFADNFAMAAYGADGAGSVAYSLVLNGSNVASGLYALDSADSMSGEGDGRGAEILLNQSGNIVTGSVGGVAYFTIAIDPSTGVVTFAQLRPVWNPSGGSSFDEAARLELADGTLLVRQTVTDSDGDSDSADIDVGQSVFSIQDDGPVARPDLDSVGNATGIATGNVLTGVDVAGGDGNSTDGVADRPGADGARVVGVASNAIPANNDVSFDADNNLQVTGQHGTLTINQDGSYSYVRLTDGPLTASESFTYRLRDGDGDEVTTTLTITIDDDGVTTVIPPAGGETTTVHEAALPARGSEPEGSGEAAAPGDNGDTRESVSGSIAFTAPDGLGSISLGGQLLAGTFPQTISSNATGTLIVTGVTFDAATGAGSIAYTYTLADNTNAASAPPSFALVVTDSDGDQSGGNLVIAIVDDAPTARADTDSVTEGASTGGNVLNGTGTDSGMAGTDTRGADGAVVVGVRAGGDTSTPAGSQVGTQIAGLYGTLTLNADGSYSYAANPNSVSATQQDVFTYTIRDGDGDESTTTLTITVNNVTLTPDLEVNSVNEAALDLVQNPGDLAAGTVTGSNPDSGAETTSGQLTVANAVQFTIVGSSTGSHGVLQLNSATGAYTYTLTSPATTSPAANDGTTVGGFDSFTYTAVDANGNSVQGTIRIDIVDDVPTARDDSDTVAEGLGNVADGNVLSGTGGTDSNTSDGVADIAGADGGATVIGARSGSEAAGGFIAVPSGAGGQIIAGTYGDLLIRADGSYSYTLKVAALPAGVTGESFTYRMRDGDGDVDVAQLTISFVADTRVPTVTNATGTVYEDGLADGVQHGPNSETVTGSFLVDLKGESGSVTIGGVAVVNGAVFDTGEGTLTITGVTTAGTVTTYSYSYTLKAPLTHSGEGEINPILDPITVIVTDATGDSATGTITIGIVDDIPVAAPNSNSVTEGGLLTVPASGVLANDVFGADGQTAGGGVVGVKAGTAPGTPLTGVGSVIETSLGFLTLNANGSYTYQAKANAIGASAQDVFTYTIRDGDGDISTTTLTINLSAVNLAPDNRTVTVNEAALDLVQDSGDLAAGTVTGSAPGLATESVSGTLAVSGGSGIVYTAQQVTGTHGVFRLNADGTFTYTLTRNVDPADANNGTNTVGQVESFTYTATDAFGNTVQGTIRVDVVDDVPSVSLSRNDAAEGAISLVTQDADTDGVPGQDSDAKSFAAAFTPTFTGGADGVATSSLLYSLGFQAGDSGLKSNGNTIYLYKVGETIVGSTAAAANLVGESNKVFEVSVSNSGGSAGTVTLVQYQQIDHALAGPNSIGLADGKITLTATAAIIDGDGDQASATQTINIGANIVFQDDAPDITAALTGTQLRIDESNGETAPGEVDGPADLGSVTLSASQLYAVTMVAGSADQPETTSYRLVVTDGANSGLIHSASGQSILLYKVANSTLVEGRVGGAAGAVAFTVDVAADGTTTLTQFLAVRHLVNPANDEASPAFAANVLRVEVARTDFDGDTDLVLLDLGQIIVFEDDGPRITAAQNINIQNSGDVAHTGAFAFAVGSDGPNAGNDDIKSVTMSVQVGNQTITINPVAGAETATTATYSFSFQYATSATTNATADGTLVFNKQLGTYTVDLNQAIQPFVTINSTSQATSFLGYDIGTTTQTNSQPDVVNVLLRQDNVSTPANEALWVRLTGLSGSPGTSGGGTDLTPGELITGGTSWVSASNTANGVAGDIVNQDEVLNVDLFTTNQFGNASALATASASAIYFKLDNIGAQEDFIVNLKLWNDIDGDNVIDSNEVTTRAVYVANGDMVKGGGGVSAGPGQYSGVTLDNNDALVIIESNDYNFGTENFRIIGAQIATSDQGLTGSAIDLNGAIITNGDLNVGRSIQNGATIQSDRNDLGFKIQDIGFVSQVTTQQNATITIGVTVGDADGDTVTQTLVATVSSAADSAAAATLAVAPAGGGVSSLSTTTMQSSSQTNLKTNNASNNLTLMAGLVAGFGSMPAAASTGDVLAYQAGEDVLADSGDVWVTEASSVDASGQITAMHTELDGPALRIEESDEASRGFGGIEPLATFHEAADGDQPAISTLDGGTESAQASMPQALFGGGEIHLPAPAQMAILAKEAAGQGLDPVQTSPALDGVLADALSGGGLADADIDQMIEAAISLAGPNQRQPGERVAVVDEDANGIAELASPLAAAVSGWDGGGFGHLSMTMPAAMHMQALHGDAVQPIANG